MSYEVYATRWDDPRIVEELVPAEGLEFSMPLSDHGDVSFTATVEPGRSFWRPSISMPISGILVAKNGQPVWQGWVTADDQTGPRTFSFSGSEWGVFFEDKVPAVPKNYLAWNDHDIFRDLISSAQAVPGQDVKIHMETSQGAHKSDLTINAWGDTTAGREFKALAAAAGGPEWYVGTTGSLDAPVRQLILGDRLGFTEATTTLEFVDDTEDYSAPEGPPMLTLLGNLFPAAPEVPATRRGGGNVLAARRKQSISGAATVVRASGAGQELARLVRTATSSKLLGYGFPRMTAMPAYSDVELPDTLQAHANADLATMAGVATTYSLVTLDGNPDWAQTPRGSTVRVVLDTDVYGAERPVGGSNGFTSRLLNTIVRVPADGPAQVEWVTASVLEF